MNIDQKINFKMANLVATYILTKDVGLRKVIPSNLKTKARYNTCYDFVRPTVPLSEVNKFIREGSDKAKTYLKSNLSRSKYLKVTLVGTPVGIRVIHSLINELPLDWLDMERTGAVRFVESDKVEIE